MPNVTIAESTGEQGHFGFWSQDCDWRACHLGNGMLY